MLQKLSPEEELNTVRYLKPHTAHVSGGKRAAATEQVNIVLFNRFSGTRFLKFLTTAHLVLLQGIRE